MTTTSLLAIAFVMPLMMVMTFGIAAIQWPYEMYEHPDDSITIYRHDPQGMLPLLHFQNLQQLLLSFGVA